MRTHWSQTTKLLEVVSVQPLLSGADRLLQPTGDIHLPPVLHQLFRDRMESPHTFVLSLAFLFSGYVTPRGTFFKLKLGLLLRWWVVRMMVSLVVIMACMCWQLE